MRVRLYGNPLGLALQEETETATADLAWADSPGASKPSVSAGATGTYYLTLSATSVSTEVTDRHYICGIQVLQ